MVIVAMGDGLALGFGLQAPGPRLWAHGHRVGRHCDALSRPPPLRGRRSHERRGRPRAAVVLGRKPEA